jgi:hypothetical protein
VLQLIEDQLAMLLEYAEAFFERMEQRFRELRGIARVERVLDDYSLASDVGLHFGDVPVGLRQDVPERDSWISPATKSPAGAGLRVSGINSAVAVCQLGVALL